MPHIRIDLKETHRPQISRIGEALHESLVEGLDMDPDDLFQIFHVHSDDEIRFSPTFPHAQRDDIVFIQVLSGFGYDAAAKQRMYAEMGKRMPALGIPEDHLLVSIIEINGDENWCAPAHVVAV